jgi:hypothetical protein
MINRDRPNMMTILLFSHLWKSGVPKIFFKKNDTWSSIKLKQTNEHKCSRQAVVFYHKRIQLSLFEELNNFNFDQIYIK